MCTENASAWHQTSKLEEPRPTHQETSAGSSDTEVKLLLTIPAGVPFRPVAVTTVMPAVQWRIARRSSSACTGACSERSIGAPGGCVDWV